MYKRGASYCWSIQEREGERISELEHARTEYEGERIRELEHARTEYEGIQMETFQGNYYEKV